MEQISYITNPTEELKTLALAYVQGQDLTKLSPEEVLDLYNATLTKMWRHYENSIV